MKRPETILAESQNYCLGGHYECGYMVDKRNGQDIYIGDCYCDVKLGVIDKDENWALLFGHYDFYLWLPTQTQVESLHDTLPKYERLFQSTYDIRQVSDFEVEILEDFRLNKKPGIYSFNIKTRVVKRVRNFKKLDIRFAPYYYPKVDW
ncbi:hypothetical protein P1X15_29735 [Runella sp. MFBS21]|uniref:hypothetical protein n=1 Tax=Runella sp. MFBS21 TaxID=3034018 RepID=UPI0023FA3475|nr:hypothetical protein [Runella sp. MFBS21]MDF7821834.1 hypothetical protein [Runella sp. MFBS21]